MAQINTGTKIAQEKMAATARANPTGDTIFVDSVNGKDGHDGTSKRHALATLTQAVTKAQAGDTIILNPGGSETVTAAIALSLARVKVVCPADNARSGFALSGAGTLDLISVTAADVVIKGVQFKHTGATANASGVLASAAAHRLTVRNCVFDDASIVTTFTGVGVELTAGADDLVVEGCTFLSCKYGVQIVAASTAESDRSIIRDSVFYVGAVAAGFGVHAASATGKVQGPLIADCLFLEADGDGSAATVAWDGTNGTDATTGPVLFGAAVDQYMIVGCRAQTALDQAFSTLDAIDAGANGEVVDCLTAAAQSVAAVYSDTTVLVADTTVIKSDTTVIEAGFVAIASDTVIIESDIVRVMSDTTAVHTLATTIASDTKVIETVIATAYSDTAALVTATTNIYSDTTKILSDTLAIEAVTITIASDTLATEALATTIASDTLAIEATATTIASDTLAIEANAVIIASDTLAIEANAVIIASDTLAIEANAVIIASDTLAIEADVTIIASDTLAIEATVDGLAAWDVRTVKKSSLALTAGAVADVFAIANGPVQLLGLVTHVTEAVSADACDCKWELDPTVGAANTDLCTVVDIVSAALGDCLYITGASGGAQVKAANATAVPLTCVTGPVLMPGGIDLSLANSNPSTGIADVYLAYRPLTSTAIVTAP
jgi:parallel beta helix pectate lyase-like protein